MDDQAEFVSDTVCLRKGQSLLAFLRDTHIVVIFSSVLFPCSGTVLNLGDAGVVRRLLQMSWPWC